MHTLAHLTAMFDSTDYSKLLLHFSDQKPAEVKREDDQYVRRLSARHFLKCLKIEFISALFHCQDPHQKLNWAFSSLRNKRNGNRWNIQTKPGGGVFNHTSKSRSYTRSSYQNSLCQMLKNEKPPKILQGFLRYHVHSNGTETNQLLWPRPSGTGAILKPDSDRVRKQIYMCWYVFLEHCDYLSPKNVQSPTEWMIICLGIPEVVFFRLLQINTETVDRCWYLPWA